MAVIEIEIISDVVCVWCFVGKRTLEKAISIYQKTYPGGKDDEFRIRWRPFYLHEGRITHSMDKSEAKKIKLAGVSEDKVAAMHRRMDQIGQSVGIHFNDGGRIGPTREAHRLTHLVQDGRKYPARVQDALVESLFRGFHELERDISSREMLREMALDAGVEAKDVDEWFGSDVGGDVVDAEARKNRELVTSGVPTFFVQGVHRVDGAQDLDEFVEAFIKVKEGRS